jgi:hypothetical protein
MLGAEHDPMYWLMPVGLAVGIAVVWAFERLADKQQGRQDLFKTFARKDAEVDARVDELIKRRVDGLVNVVDFWSGAVLHAQVNKERLIQVYELLGLVCALLLSIGVTFYTANTKGSHLYGLVCCICNCALWMATLSSTFFLVAINSFESDEQLQLLVELYGTHLMRVPIIMFVWGTSLLFLEFVLYFKLNVDPGLSCSACLGACFAVVPLFFHCMHKMGWAAAIIQLDNEIQTAEATMPTPDDLRDNLRAYVDTVGGNCLALDRDEFLDFCAKSRGKVKVTSVQRTFAGRIFDAHVDAALADMDTDAGVRAHGEQGEGAEGSEVTKPAADKPLRPLRADSRRLKMLLAHPDPKMLLAQNAAGDV